MNVKELFLLHKSDFEDIWECLYAYYYIGDIDDDVTISSIYEDFESFWIQVAGANSVKPIPHKKAKYIFVVEIEDINNSNNKYYDIMCSNDYKDKGRIIKNMTAKEVLYLEIILSNYYQYRPEHFIAHLLYDMTYDGFDVNKSRKG
jgi:hypothetical protein